MAGRAMSGKPWRGRSPLRPAGGLSIPGFALALTCWAAHAAADPSAGSQLQTRCDVAKQILSRLARRRPAKPWIFVRPDASLTLANNQASEISSDPRWRDPPGLALAQLYLRERSSDPLSSCGDFPSAVARLGGSVGNSEALWKKELDLVRPEGSPDPLWSYWTQSMSLPVLSADGREALAEVDGACGMTCGSGFLLHLRRDRAGQWIVADRLVLWIS